MQRGNYPTTEGEIPVLRWSNRRRMAWMAFLAMVAGTALFWFALPLWFHLWGLPTTWLNIIGETYSWFASAMTLIIAAYLGFGAVAGGKFKATRIPFTKGSESYDDNDYDKDEIYDPNKVKE